MVLASTRHRAIQIGKQTVLGTAVPATRRVPWSGVANVDLGYEEDEADVGSLDPVMAPYRTAIDATLPVTGKLNYNDLPYLYAGAFKGGVTPTGGGAAKTWTYQLASLTSDDFEYFTLQQGSTDSANNWWQLVGSIVEAMEFTSPDNLGPFDMSATWRAADAKHKSSTDSPVSGTVPTTGLDVDANPVRVFAADTELFIDDAFGSLGNTKVSDAVYALTFSVQPTIDQKRFMNGSNTRFALAGYTRGPRVISVSATFAESSDIVGTGSESDDWFSDDPVNRFVRIKTTGRTFLQAGVPYSNTLDMPIRWMTREQDTINNNTVIRLTGNVYLDPDLDYALKAVVVNSLTAL